MYFHRLSVRFGALYCLMALQPFRFRTLEDAGFTVEGLVALGFAVLHADKLLKCPRA